LCDYFARNGTLFPRRSGTLAVSVLKKNMYNKMVIWTKTGDLLLRCGDLENWIIEIMNQFGYIGVFLLIMLENLFPPIPSEVILTFGGFMTTTTNMTVLGIIVFSTLGSVLGALVLYGIGLLLEEKKLNAIIDKYGRFLRLTREDVHKAYAWFDKYGAWAVFLCRLVPLVRSLISIPAGSVRMNIVTFLLLTTVGSLIWNTALVNIGAAVGASWETIVDYMDIYSNIVYAALFLLAVLFIVLYIRKKFWKGQ
jgi:membrane protein DedA with SNARE-associated domain